MFLADVKDSCGGALTGQVSTFGNCIRV